MKSPEKFVKCSCGIVHTKHKEKMCAFCRELANIPKGTYDYNAITKMRDREAMMQRLADADRLVKSIKTDEVTDSDWERFSNKIANSLYPNDLVDNK